MDIIEFPSPPRKRPDGIVGRVRPRELPLETLHTTIAVVRRESHLRVLAQRPDQFLDDLASWIERRMS